MAKKILIVDDSSMMRLVVKKAAKKEGYEVIEASNGQEGLDVLEKEDVNLILSDINMPVMDGLEMVKRIKENDALKYIPIVMLTTERSEDLKQKGRELGVKAWMVKPFNEATFLKAMMKLLG